MGPILWMVLVSNRTSFLNQQINENNYRSTIDKKSIGTKQYKWKLDHAQTNDLKGHH